MLATLFSMELDGRVTTPHCDNPDCSQDLDTKEMNEFTPCLSDYSLVMYRVTIKSFNSFLVLISQHWNERGT